MKKITAYKKFILLLAGWISFFNGMSQEFENISIEIHFGCPDPNDPRSNLKDIDFEFYNYSNDIYYGHNNYKTYDNYGCTFVEGITNKIRVVAKPKPGTENTILPYIISKIEIQQMKEDNSTETGNPQVYNVGKKDVTLDITLLPFQTEGKYYKMKIYIERCMDEKAVDEVSVKVIGTISESEKHLKEGSVFKASDYTISIGDKVVTLDEDGIGWLKIRPDTYKMSYTRANSKIGYVNLKATKTNKEDQLPSVIRPGNSTINECTVPLLKENGNSGNLYDYELKINMISTLSHCTMCTATVTELKPDVQINLAGTPEEEWTPAYDNMLLHMGDVISEDPDGEVTLRFCCGEVAKLKNATFLKLASYFEEGGVIRVEILLKMGEVAAKVNRSEATKSDFCIKSPTATISVRGTTYNVRYDPKTNTTTVWVYEGTVSVIPKNPALNPVALSSGQQIQIGENTVSSIGPITADKINTGTQPATTYSDPVTTTTPVKNNAPAWSRGEQLLPITFQEAIKRAETALIAEGYVNLQKQANFVTGYKGMHTAIIMCNDAPNNKQWINIVVASISTDGNVPGAERVKLQKQMEVQEVFNKPPATLPPTAKSIDWYANPADLGLRGKNNQQFSFTCPAMDYLGHRLYGTDTYTDDSSICTAGVHAGAITTSGGTVTIEILPEQNAYVSSNRNGIHSDGYGYWPGSFKVVK